MVIDHFIDMEETGGLWLRGWRCVTCGEVVDPMIMRHRMLNQSRFGRMVEAVARKKRRVRDIVRLSA
jgi:hypothetical protein